MKLARTLLLGGGVLNALFVLFHVWLGWRILQWPQLAEGVRTLLSLLNGGGALSLGFVAAASLALPTEVLASRLGHALLWFTSALHLGRALAEAAVSPRLNPAIFTACAVTGALYAGAALLARRAATGPQPGGRLA
jgi:hypothetical protein